VSHTQAATLYRANELLDLRELDDAVRTFSKAEIEGAEFSLCCAGRWMAYMLQGNFASAWAESDTIRERGTSDPHRFWQGEDLSGKRVVLRCLHGLGDAVQFLRYVPALRSVAGSLDIEVPPALFELAPCFTGVHEVITWGAGAPPVPSVWDVQVEINELPYLFRTTAEQLPLATRYLHVPDASLRDNAPQATSPANLHVGLVWASGDWKPSRSVPFELLRPVLDCRGCEFWNLQGGNDRQRWSELSPCLHLHNAKNCDHSILSLAATIAQLDLIITSDTLAAHLAGALGIPAWVMLERAADWRWQYAREDSPWYPSLRLFRQNKDREWDSVIAHIVHELHACTLHGRMVA
jgi:hypothetical protein